MKRLALIAVLLLALTGIVACGGASLPNLGARQAQSSTDHFSNGPAIAAPAATAAPAAPPMLQPSAATDSAGKTANGGDVTQALNQATTDRMVVYTGTLSLEVQDTEATIAKIGDVLKANQGYISNRSLDRDSQGQLSGSITIRVPAGSLDATLTQIKALGLKTVHEDAQSADVTQEYVDLDARRKNLEAYEVELTKLLDTVRENSGKAQDLLAVYNQLTDVRGQIEQIKGRQNYLQNTSTLATYTIQLVPHEVVAVANADWDPGNTTRQALHSLVLSLQGLADLGITFIFYVLPILLVLALPFIILFLIARRLWRNRAPKRVATA